MRGIFIQIFWQIDDLNGIEWASLRSKHRIQSSNHLVCQITISNNLKQRTRSNIAQTLTQIPHPMHNSSEMKAVLEAEVTSIHSFPEKKQVHRNVNRLNSNTITPKPTSKGKPLPFQSSNKETTSSPNQRNHFRRNSPTRNPRISLLQANPLFVTT